MRSNFHKFLKTPWKTVFTKHIFPKSYISDTFQNISISNQWFLTLPPSCSRAASLDYAKSKQTGKPCQRTDREEREETGNSGWKDMGMGVRPQACSTPLVRPAPCIERPSQQNIQGHRSNLRGLSRLQQITIFHAQRNLPWSHSQISVERPIPVPGPPNWLNWVQVIGWCHVPNDFKAKLPF